MPLFQGVGPRIAARLIELEYVRADGKPDVRRFCREHGYDKTLFYYWLRDRSTPMKERTRLARDLKTTSRWLLLGDEEEGRAIRGASDVPSPPIQGASDAHEPAPSGIMSTSPATAAARFKSIRFAAPADAPSASRQPGIWASSGRFSQTGFQTGT